MMLPRADVGTSSLAAAVAVILMQLLGLGSGAGFDSVAFWGGLTVVLMFCVEYAVPAAKEKAGTIAGAVVVILSAIVAYLQNGTPFVEESVVSAVTYLVGLLLVWGIPAIQPGGSAST